MQLSIIRQAIALFHQPLKPTPRNAQLIFGQKIIAGEMVIPRLINLTAKNLPNAARLVGACRLKKKQRDWNGRL
jgi:hypothetical protein